MNIELSRQNIKRRKCDCFLAINFNGIRNIASILYPPADGSDITYWITAYKSLRGPRWFMLPTVLKRWYCCDSYSVCLLCFYHEAFYVVSYLVPCSHVFFCFFFQSCLALLHAPTCLGKRELVSKTCLRGLRSGYTQTGMRSHRSYVEARNFGCRS